MPHLTDKEDDKQGKEGTPAPSPSEDSRRLQESGERYRTLVNSIDAGFCVIEVLFDTEGTPQDYRFLETNPAFDRNTGLVDAVGKTMRELVPEIDSFWSHTYGAVALTGQAVRFENHEPAMSRWFDVHASRVGPPENRQVGVLFTDITARKEAEETLRLAEERERVRLTDIFMRAPAFMAALRGPHHTFELANLPYYQLIGRTERDSIIGKTVAEVLPEMAEQGIIALLDRVYRTGEALVGTDKRVVFRSSASGASDERFVAFNFQALFDESGAVSGILIHGVDLTERRHLEQEREKLLEHQQQLVADLRQAGVRQRQFLKEMLLGFTEGRLHLCDGLDELPPPLARLSETIILNDARLRLLRRTVEAEAANIGIPRERINDFITAIHEAAMNALKYGGGGTATVRGDAASGRLQVWIEDNGPGIAEDLIHRAVEQGWTTGGFGQGFFLMRSCSDRLFLLTRKTGTTVVLEMDRDVPLPLWLQGIR